MAHTLTANLAHASNCIKKTLVWSYFVAMIACYNYKINVFCMITYNI